MARPPKGKPLTIRAIRLDDDVWAACQRLGKEHGTINEGLRAQLLTEPEQALPIRLVDVGTMNKLTDLIIEQRKEVMMAGKRPSCLVIDPDSADCLAKELPGIVIMPGAHVLGLEIEFSREPNVEVK